MNRDTLLDIYTRTMKVARADEKFRSLLMTGKLAVIYYTVRGQELVSAAMMAALNQDDYLVTTYRGQHDQIAKGVPLDLLFAEIAGKATGTCKGKGGSMHITHPDDRLITRKSRHSFANINLKSRDGRVEGMDGALRFDTQTGTEDLWHFGPGASAGEVIFAPAIGATDEAQGYAMTLVHHANSATSELAIFNAMDIAAGPVARVLIPFRVPSGFHCNYYSAESGLYAQALNQGKTIQ